jgi:uncharacterized membrane protein YphA (DoxX/SURF4 family)
MAIWILIGHGFPKLSHWLLGVSTWGGHSEFVARDVFAGLTAVLEFVGPILIIAGLFVSLSAGLLFLMFLMSSLLRPFPWFFERVAIEGYEIPFAILPAKEISLLFAFGFLGVALFCKDEALWKEMFKRLRKKK